MFLDLALRTNFPAAGSGSAVLFQIQEANFLRIHADTDPNHCVVPTGDIVHALLISDPDPGYPVPDTGLERRYLARATGPDQRYPARATGPDPRYPVYAAGPDSRYFTRATSPPSPEISWTCYWSPPFPPDILHVLLSHPEISWTRY